MREDWYTNKLTFFCESIVGGGTPSTKTEEYWNGDIPWISSADILGVKEIVPRKFVTKEGIANSATNKIEKGTIIVVTRVGLGKLAIAPYSLCFSQDNQGVKFYNGLVDIKYALYYLSLAVYEFKFSGRGTTINGVTKKQLKDLQFKLAPLPEQRAIVSKIEQLFSELDNGIANLKTAKDKLEIYRQAVLKKAFEGELTKEWREKQTDLPSADELLAQIKEERQKHYEKQLQKWEQAVAEWEINGKEGKKPRKPQKNKHFGDLTEDELNVLPSTASQKS